RRFFRRKEECYGWRILGTESHVEFLVLGPLEVRDGDRVLPLGGAKQRAMLALLLLHRNEVVARDRLIDGLWGDRPPAGAPHALETYVSRLRGVLRAGGISSRLIARPPGYFLRVDEGELDLSRFETLIEEGRTALSVDDPAVASEALGEALSLVRGAPLEDL